jgi:hypothetical protein
VLYYFISEPTTFPILLTLSDPRSAKRFVDVSLPSPNRPGFWPIRLKDYGIILDAGVEYRWFVSVIQQRQENIVILDGDIVAGGGGVVECCPDDLEYVGPIGCESTATVFYNMTYGIWYDAFACLGELIEADANNEKLRRLRERLLRDTGLILTEPR